MALFTLFALQNSSLGETETKFLQKASKITWGHHGKPNTSLSQAWNLPKTNKDKPK